MVVEFVLNALAWLVTTVVDFLATLFATLIGVVTAFGINRRAEEHRSKRQALEHLNSLQKELELNEKAATGNQKVADTFSRGRQKEVKHYVMELFPTDAWKGAVEGQLIRNIDEGVYHDLQDLYQHIENSNEQMRRLRTEFLAAEIGETKGSGGYEREVWTISVGYWNHDRDEYDLWGLGVLIGLQAEDIERSIGYLRTDLEGEIQSIQEELTEMESERWFRMYSTVFGAH